MGTISVSLPSDGTTADVSDYNTPISTIVNAINGGLDTNNLSASAAIATGQIADGAVTNAKLSTTAGQIGGAWSTWTPTWTGLSAGNGTLTAAYQQVGKAIRAELMLVFGSTTSISAVVSLTLPVTAASRYATNLRTIGRSFMEDTGVAGYHGSVFSGDNSGVNATSCKPLVYITSGTYATDGAMTSSAPFTWSTGDKLSMWIEYEAA